MKLSRICGCLFSTKSQNFQYLAEQLAVKVSYIQVGSRCDHVIFTSSEQRSFGLLEQVSKAQCEGLSAVLVKAETLGSQYQYQSALR